MQEEGKLPKNVSKKTREGGGLEKETLPGERMILQLEETPTERRAPSAGCLLGPYLSHCGRVPTRSWGSLNSLS